jgi:asparagine synthase (glutamine-hydrolysing)
VSAILGRIDLDGAPVDDRAFAAAVARLAHYGEQSAVVHEGAAALAVLHLPLRSDRPARAEVFRDGPLLVVADAILDTREAAPGEDVTDAALVGRAFARWGARASGRLHGDYAFAAWDGKARRLTLVRDHLGTRPLHWARRGASMRFATDIRGILDPGEDWRIDEEAVARHLAGPNRPMPRGFIRGVELVPPGSVVTIDASGVRTDRWWRPRDLPELRHARDADYVEHLRDLLRQAIDARVDAELPIGTHLSGGIDSGVVCIAASDALAARGARLRAAYAWSPPVSDTFPELGRRDERRRIAPIAELAGTPLRFGRAECASLDHLDREIEFEGINNLDEELSVLGAAQGDGVRILLSGWGGDEGFSAHGYGSLAHLLRCGRLVAAFNSTRAHAGGRRHPVALLRALLAWGVAPLMPDPLYRRLAPFRDHYAEGSFQSARLKALPQDRGPYNGEDVRLTGDPRRYLADLVLMGHLSSRMETWATWSAGHGVQYRYPLLDRRLVEFMLAVPARLHTADGYGRWLARGVMAGRVPGPLHKEEKANEALRAADSLARWRLLKARLEASGFPEDSAWIDMPAFRAAVTAVPGTFEGRAVIDFARISAAARMLSLEARWRGGGAGRP